MTLECHAAALKLLFLVKLEYRAPGVSGASSPLSMTVSLPKCVGVARSWHERCPHILRSESAAAESAVIVVWAYILPTARSVNVAAEIAVFVVWAWMPPPLHPGVKVPPPNRRRHSARMGAPTPRSESTAEIDVVLVWAWMPPQVRIESATTEIVVVAVWAWRALQHE